jgi:hypothetical protein
MDPAQVGGEAGLGVCVSPHPSRRREGLPLSTCSGTMAEHSTLTCRTHLGLTIDSVAYSGDPFAKHV